MSGWRREVVGKLRSLMRPFPVKSRGLCGAQAWLGRDGAEVPMAMAPAKAAGANETIIQKLEPRLGRAIVDIVNHGMHVRCVRMCAACGE